MSWMTSGADVGTMVTGAAALTAVIVWVKGQVEGWQAKRLARAHRNWNGYIDVGGVVTWGVRLVPRQPGDPEGRVVLDVVNGDGTPNIQMAQQMGTVVQTDGFISRAPTPEQWRFLIDLRHQQPRGYPVL
jgi:hypothetical protein